MDKHTFYQTPAIRRRKRKAASVQPPPAIHMCVGGKWETFTSKAELVAFMAGRRGR